MLYAANDALHICIEIWIGPDHCSFKFYQSPHTFRKLLLFRHCCTLNEYGDP